MPLDVILTAGAALGAAAILIHNVGRFFETTLRLLVTYEEMLLNAYANIEKRRNAPPPQIIAGPVRH